MRKTTAASPNPKLDGYFRHAERWQAELQKLRALALSCNLNEEMKWGKPCYQLQSANIVLIHEFKDYCALLFFKGALLNDPNGLLVQQTQNVQSARQIRFTSLQDVVKNASVIKHYIEAAIEVENSGLQVDRKTTTEFEIPDELAARFKNSRALKAAFGALTPGRQRGYLLHFSGAKQSKTREARIEKWTPHILAGKGLDDE